MLEGSQNSDLTVSENLPNMLQVFMVPETDFISNIMKINNNYTQSLAVSIMLV
jgi:hypothetical protein